MELEAAKMIGAGLAAIALAGAGVGIGIIFDLQFMAHENCFFQKETEIDAKNFLKALISFSVNSNNRLLYVK